MFRSNEETQQFIPVVSQIVFFTVTVKCTATYTNQLVTVNTSQAYRTLRTTRSFYPLFLKYYRPDDDLDYNKPKLVAILYNCLCVWRWY
jgi:hypothetical protein